MPPLIINTHDQGGAANACLRLHRGLLQQGIKSKVLLKHKTDASIPETYQISLQAIERSFGTKISEKAIRILKELKLYKEKPDLFLANRPAGLEMFSFPQSNYDLTKSELYRQADIINLHWVANFLDYPSFFKKNKKPVVWTLHDQNPFLALEHYAETIVGMDENGYPIKRKLSEFERNKFDQFINVKQRALENTENLTVVTPSVWLTEEAKKSVVFNRFKAITIPYGLNSNIFKPLNKIFCRELLNIPLDKIVILFVADSISNKRKGFEYLLKAFEKIEKSKTVLLSVGKKQSSLNQNDNYFELGKISDERLMSIIYSAADVFIIPSLMDNLPNTVLESIMCGTPVIGFPVGGIPDMIQDGENGYLTDEISVPALVKTIEKFIETSTVFDSKKIRESAVEKYDLSVQAQNYITLYNKIIAKS